MPSHHELQLSLTGARSTDPGDGITSGLEDTTACQLFSPAMLGVPIVLQGKSLKAVVDTAATSTRDSDKVYSEMEPSPPCLKAVTLRTTGLSL